MILEKYNVENKKEFDQPGFIALSIKATKRLIQ